MADLFNQQISATYSGLLKTSSSGVLSASLAQITDGRGNVSQLYLSTTSVQFYGLYTFPNTDGTANQVLKTDGAGVLTWENDANSGTVTSVALSVPTGLTVTGSPITTSGTITIGGTLGVANGGTGATTLTGVLVGNGTSAISSVTDGTVGQVLSTNGSGTYSFADAATGDVSISGTPVANQVAIWTDATTIKGETGLIYTSGRLELNQIEIKGISPKLSINASTSGDPTLDFQDSGNTKASLFYDTVFDEEKFVIRAYAVDTVFERAIDTPTLTIDGSNGNIKFNSYGSASPHTGTLAKTLGVDASGNVIEFTAATGDVTKTGAIALNTIAVWNDNSDQLRSDTTMSINANHTISLLQKNSSDTDVSSYNVGGGNIANVTGQNNTGFGQSNMQRVTTGSNNVAFGNSTLDKLTTGSNNTTVGKASLFSLTEGDGNTSVGDSSLDEVTTGDNNTAIGKDSGNAITTGSNNVIIGSNTGSTIATSSNNIIISDGDGNSRIQVNSGGDVGIGVSNPSDYYAKDLVVTGPAEGGITIASTGNHTNYLLFADSSSGVARYAGMVGYAHNTDLMEFRTNSVQRMVIDNSGNVGIGTSGTPSAKLDVLGKDITIGGDNGTWTARTDSTIKVGAITFPHYLTAQKDIAALVLVGTSTSNEVDIGGGTSSYNAATQITFLTAANTTTLTGTPRLTISSGGNVDVASSYLRVMGNASANTAGVGVELSYNTASDRAQVGAYDRTNDAYKQLYFYASDYIFDAGGTPKLTISSGGTISLNVMSTFDVEGYVKMGRSDGNTSRYNQIKNKVSSTQANNFMKLSVHNGTENSTTDALTLSGTGTATFSNGIQFANPTPAYDSGATTLDAYEEGTFTVSLISSGGGANVTPTNTTGYYTRVGNKVTVQYYSGLITVTAIGSGAGVVSGLPYTSNTQIYSTLTLTHVNCYVALAQNGFVNVGTNQFYAIQSNSTASMAWNSGSYNKYFMLGGTYFI